MGDRFFICIAQIKIGTHILQRLAAFDSLHNRHFRWFWLGRLATSACMEMRLVAQGWLVYQLTGSALALGWVAAGRGIARLILSLCGGALADRLEKRQLLIWTRAAMAINVLVIALLVLTGAIRVWHLAVQSFLSGVISSFMMPAQKALLAQLVGRKAILNAVSLTSMGMGLMGILGASLSGFIIEWLGVESVYLIMTALYFYALYTVTRLPLTGNEKSHRTSMWIDLREGLRYLKVCAPLLPLLGIAMTRALLGWSYRTLMPVYAEEVMHLDASGLGILSAAPGIGSLIGSLVLASLGNFKGKGKVLLASGLAMGLSLIAFASTRQYGLVLFVLMLTGVARNATMITNQTLIQMSCQDAYRGRVMAMYMMVMSLIPLGTIPAGAVADTWGVSSALLLQGALMATIFAAFWLTRSRVRDLQ
jgi:MFS family permease